jgi:hypothetical protein
MIPAMYGCANRAEVSETSRPEWIPPRPKHRVPEALDDPEPIITGRWPGDDSEIMTAGS